MKDKQWADLIEANYEEIFEAMLDALRENLTYHSITEVILDENGKVDIARYVSENTTDRAVWDGKAIAIVRFTDKEGVSIYNLSKDELIDVLIDLNMKHLIEKLKNTDVESFADGLNDDILEKINSQLIDNQVDYYATNKFDAIIAERQSELIADEQN